jgi:hypothetical protein
VKTAPTLRRAFLPWTLTKVRWRFTARVMQPALLVGVQVENESSGGFWWVPSVAVILPPEARISRG